jgi:hypothetical protein
LSTRPHDARILPLVLGTVSLFALPVQAGFFNCPEEVDPELGTGRVCRVESTRDAIEVFASDDDDGALALRSWTVDGEEQLDRQQLLLYDATLGDFPDLDLTTTSRDEGRDQIIIVFEDPLETYGVNVTWEIRGETLNTAITSFSTSSANAQTIFVYSDFALGGSDDDDLVEVDDVAPGAFIGFVDGDFSTNSGIPIPAFPAPTDFDTGTAAEFSSLLDSNLVALDGTKVTSGPADLVSIQAWDYVHEAPFSFRIEFAQSITVPVPEPEGAGVAALLAIALVTRRRVAARAESDRESLRASLRSPRPAPVTVL